MLFLNFQNIHGQSFNSGTYMHNTSGSIEAHVVRVITRMRVTVWSEVLRGTFTPVAAHQAIIIDTCGSIQAGSQAAAGV